MRKRVILITGAVGEIGQALVHRLAEGKDDRLLTLDLDPLPSHLASLATHVMGDILDDRLLSRLVSEYEIGAIYHFRVVAENLWGTVESDDQTFQFFTPDCPNAHLRQQTGAAYLPDCRAYELVSPANAGAVQLFTGNGTGAFEENSLPPGASFRSVNRGASDAFAFFGGVGQITGTNPPNITQDMYVAKLLNVDDPEFKYFEYVETNRPDVPCLLPEELQDRCGDLPVGSLSGE